MERLQSLPGSALLPSTHPLRLWQQQSLTVIMRVTLILGFPTLLFALYDSLSQQRLFPILFYVIGYLILAATMFFPHIPFALRAGCLLLVVYSIGTIDLLASGFDVTGFLFLFTFTLLATLFLGAVGASVALLMVLVSLVTTIWLFINQFAVTGMIVETFVFLLLASMCNSALLSLIQRLNTSLSETTAMVQQVQQARRQAEKQSDELAQQYAHAAVARDEAESAHSRTAEQLAIIQQQQQTIRELSVPILPLSAHTLVMPLVGAIDSERAQQIMERLLEGIATYRATMAILDITGVQIVDTQVANALIQAARAVKLLGARVILTGVQPQMAHTLVQLGIDLRGITTHSTLQEGIGYALAQTSKV